MPNLQVTYEIGDANTVEQNIATFAQKLADLDAALGPVLTSHLASIGTGQPNVSAILTALEAALISAPTEGGL